MNRLPTTISPSVFPFFLSCAVFYIFLLCFSISSNTAFPLSLAAFHFRVLSCSSTAASSSQYIFFQALWGISLNADFSHSSMYFLSSLSGCISYLGCCGFCCCCCTFSPQFLLFSLSHFHFLLTFPGLDPTMQPPVKQQRVGASGERTVIFIHSALSYGCGQVACNSSRHKHKCIIRLVATL